MTLTTITSIHSAPERSLLGLLLGWEVKSHYTIEATAFNFYVDGDYIDENGASWAAALYGVETTYGNNEVVNTRLLTLTTLKPRGELQVSMKYTKI